MPAADRSRVGDVAAAATLDGATAAEPNAVEDVAGPPEEPVSEESEILPAMDENGEPVGGATHELPPVEDLAKRLRPEVLTALDELFRAKWTGVKRLRPGDLKPGL